MALVIDIRHWLDEHGEPVPAVRRRALRVARLIEYGGPLAPRHTRPTLVECSRRGCHGLLWVVKQPGGTIDALCPDCEREHLVIEGWESTCWAEGPLPALPVGESDPSLPN